MAGSAGVQEADGLRLLYLLIAARLSASPTLFKSSSKTNTRSRFYVFLRCSVLRNASFEDLRYISLPALVAAGVDDDLPVVVPRIIR